MVRALAFLAAIAAGPSFAYAAQSPFDGDWMVSLACPATPDGHALAFAYEFQATVKDGVLHGERGEKDQPGWLSLDGRIAADGHANLIAEGRTNLPAYALYNAPKGRPYKRDVQANFEGRRGSGSWITIRTCTFTFERR